MSQGGRLSRVLAPLAGLALTAGVALVYVNAAVFDADGFAARVDQSLRTEAVSAELARRVTDQALAARPDLVAVRPLIETAAQGVVRGAAFRSIVRGAARDVHRSAFDRDADTVTLTLSDAGLLLAEALEHLRPDLAGQIPAELRVRLAATTGELDRTALRVAEFGERVRAGALFALLAAAGLGVAALLTSPSRRVGVLRLGIAVAVCGGLAAAASALAPRVLAGTPAARAVLATWLDPLTAWCAALAGVGAIAALAAASVLRPVAVRPGLSAVARSPRTRAVAPVIALALGLALVLWPRTLVDVAAVTAGVVLALAGAGELLRRTGAPAPREERRRVPPVARLAAAAAALAAAVVGLAAIAGGGGTSVPQSGRCNGSAALCERPLDQVAFVGTHNSMAAEGEPGWLFAAQNAGIDAQLHDGVRSLLIDTHYGFATPRGVATDLSGESKSRAKVVSEVGEQFVATAERLRTRIGYEGGGQREIFLCHAFCEVGATPALAALEGVHRFLVEHPEEVLILSLEDDTSSADTAALIRDSGLIREVYRGPVEPPWPTLGELIERDERVLVLVEYHPEAEPWMHSQAAVAQETPFHFATATELAADECRPNRGGLTGSLLLVNHWVDTSPAPRVTIAREVNARAFVEARLARCRAERRPFPTVLAVDFYREGDVFGTVARVNERVTRTG